jgi:hypothetical protein
MKKINWKGSLITLGIVGVVGGAATWSTISINNQNTHVQTASTNDDSGTYKAVQDSNDSNKISFVPDHNADSPFVNDDYMKDTQKIKPEIGMTVSEVDDSTWGRAGDITTTKTQYGESQLWIYMDGRSLFFDNGVLESITQ